MIFNPKEIDFNYLAAISQQMGFASNNISAVPYVYTEQLIYNALGGGSTTAYMTLSEPVPIAILPTAVQYFYYGYFDVLFTAAVVGAAFNFNMQGVGFQNGVALATYILNIPTAAAATATNFNTVRANLPVITTFSYFVFLYGGFTGTNAFDITIKFNGLRVTAS